MTGKDLEAVVGVGFSKIGGHYPVDNDIYTCISYYGRVVKDFLEGKWREQARPLIREKRANERGTLMGFVN